MATTTDDRATRTPGRLGLLEGLRRQVDYWGTVYRRTWRASVVTSFVSPIFYVVAMGVVLGGFVTADSSRLDGAPSYLAFVVPGLVAAYAMQTAVGETTWPVMSRVKWDRTYHAMLATPLEPRHVALGHLGFALGRVALTCGVFMLVLAPFGLFATWWGPFAAYAAQLLTGATFAALTYAMSIRMRSEAGFGVYFRLVVFPLFLFSGAFFPVANLGEVGAAAARLTPLWHGVSLSRMFALGQVDWSLAAVNASVLVVLAALGTRWSVRGLAARMVDA
jgi:lipooligosaccharide transport system permease protein